MKVYMMTIQKIKPAHTLLKSLQDFPVPELSKEKFDSQHQIIESDFNIMSFLNKCKSDFSIQDDWCAAIAMIHRNKIDARGIRATVLPNRDALAALLATRVGINMHLAVALAFDDMIAASFVNNSKFVNMAIGPNDAVVLATFSTIDDPSSFMALYAHKEARAYKLRYQPEELILFDEQDDDRTFWPFQTFYFTDREEGRLNCRFDEAVYFESEGEEQVLLRA